MIDSITNLYTSMQQSAQSQEVSTAVLARSIEAVQQAGENVEGLLQSAGGAAAETGAVFTDPMVGGQVDLQV